MAPGAAVSFAAPDVEQTGSMLCWAASAADVLAAETGQDAATIYRSLTAASGNTPGFVETALSWYSAGAAGELRPQAFDGSHTVSRQGFETPEALAATLREAFTTARAVSLMLYARGAEQGTGHAVTVYASEQVGERLYLSYADSADGVQGLRRAEVLAVEGELVLAGTSCAVGALTYLGDDASADVAPAAPVGGIMHSSPWLFEYTDMAENRGVYRFAYSPSIITYRNGEADYTVDVTPDYSSVADAGCYTLLHNGSAQVTVQHNGIMNGSTYTGRYVGEYAQKYSVAGISGNATFSFGTNNPYVPTGDDYRIERMTRLVTDTNAAAYCTDETLLSNMAGVTVYRVGAGNNGYYDTSGNFHWLASAWGAGMTAGITSLMEQIFYVPETGLIGIQSHPADFVHTSAQNPLPTGGLQGDSGSPVFIYNAEKGCMELMALLANADTTVWQAYYNPRATTEVDAYCTVSIDSAPEYNAAAAESTTMYISGAHVGENDTLLEDSGAAAYLRKGSITVNGETIAQFNGVALEEFSQGTWKKLDADSLTWYTYTDNDYLNVASATATDASTFGTDDLVYTSNLHFTAEAADGATTAHRRIELTENVDLGIGHVQFSLAEGTTSAVYDIGQSSSGYHLSSAGFVVDEGVTVNNYFTYEKGRELRRVGGGTMNMVGTGNNDVLLNIGGGGVTYLNRTGGYGAYSALVNSQAVLRLADVGQVYNNVTLGANGGVLDFNGNDYRWTSGGARAEGSDGQTYFGLTVYEGVNRVETSTLANYASGTTSTITIERTDSFEFAGAFRDGSTYTNSGSVEMDSRYTMMPSLLMGLYNQYTAADLQASGSTLRVVYNGGATMEMTGVYTLLTGDSGLEVASGTVHLHGTNTIHALGSESGTNTNRLQVADDWHYAMAETGVKVAAGASFVLGDHALLIGNVEVENGGTYVMTQAVNSRYEYVEGWCYAEDTYALADYYGHKGNVKLAAGANMEIRFDEGVDTQVTYSGNISGEGSVTVDAGKGTVKLTGKNTVSGEKTVESGHVRVAEGSQGDTSKNKWVVKEKGSIALEGVSTNSVLLTILDEVSSGVLALVESFTEQVSEVYEKLIVGAAEGEVAHYGTSSQSLQSREGKWVLGGGGGTLMVDFALEGDNKLVLGNEYGSGMVVLTNANNTFSGGIEMAGGVTLGYTNAAALGDNVVSIGYGQKMTAVDGAEFAAEKIAANSSGVFAISNGSANYDMSAHRNLSLGAHNSVTLTGCLTVAEDAPYRLGGSGELTIATELSGNHGIVVDGHGTMGSSVIFATPITATGAVVVQGYDSTQASAGEVTVSFTADNALASAASVTLRNNAGVDLNGTNQQLNNLAGDASSLIYDTQGGNTLTLHNTENTAAGMNVQAQGTEVVKTGSGTLELSGTNTWRSLSINEGTVQVSDSKSLGYLASGSQGIAVSVNEGGTLHLTQDVSLTNTLNVAGYGADGASYALVVDGQLSAGSGTLNVTADAAISGKFSFQQLNLQGNRLTVDGSSSSFTAASMADGTLRLTNGASMSLGSYQMDSSLALELDGATVNVSGASLSGKVIVGANGATINYPWNDSSTSAFNIKGLLSGSSVDSTLKLVGYKHTMNFSGGVDLAGKVEVGNGLTLNITADASIGALINEANIGDQSNVVVNGAALAITGSGNNFGSNSNPGTISLTNGGQLQLVGLEDGASMGVFGSLDMGSGGVLSLTSLAGYTSNAMMSITALSNVGSLVLDAAELSGLASGTYHLLTSGSDLSAFASTLEGRRTYTVTSTLGESGYALDLVVGEGEVAHATWQGTGTLVAGSTNATNITSSAGDSTFVTMDSLTITSAAGEDHTLTLGEKIMASSVTYTGAGTVSLADNTATFAEGVGFILDGSGRFEVDDTDFAPGSEWGTKAITGDVLLKQGTLAASTYSLNAMRSITVDGAAAIDLVNPDSSETGCLNNRIQINKGAQLTLSSLSTWGGTISNALAGEGDLVINNASSLTLLGDNSAFTGNVTVNSGTVNFGNSGYSAFSLGASSVTMAAGTTLVFSSTAVEYKADFNWGDGATLYVQEGTGDGPTPTSVGYTLSGRQTLTGTLNYQSQWGKVAHFSGDIVDGEGASGALNFTSNGHGGGSPAVVLSGNNTYSGGTTLDFSSLTLYVGSQQALGTGTLKLNAGTLAWLGVGGEWNGDLTASNMEVSGGILNTNGYNVTYSGEVRGTSGTLTKSGAGTLELTNFTYSGATHVAAGTLSLGVGKLSWYSGFSGDAGATLRLNSTNPSGTYLMGAVSGGVLLQLNGDFAMGVANTHTGGTELLSGSLEINKATALQSSALYAHAGTTVKVNVADAIIAGNSMVDALAFADGASVIVGADGAAGHLGFGSLSGTVSFLLDFFSADAYDRLSGSLAADGVLSVSLADGASAAGRYLLVAGNNEGYSVENISLTGTDESQYTYGWTVSESGITLNIFDVATGAANVWSGATSGDWDAASAWAGGSYAADKSTLVSVGQDTSIRVGTAVSTSALQTDVAENSTLSFSAEGGSITASTLQKDGEGTLRFEAGSANNFSSVVVNEGTLSVADGNALGTTNISGEGTFELTGGSMAANVSSMTVENISLAGDALLTLNYGNGNFAFQDRHFTIAEGATLLTGYWCGVKDSNILLRDGGTMAVGSVGFTGNTIQVEGQGTLAIGQTTGSAESDAAVLNTDARISGMGTLNITNYTANSSTGYAVSMSGVIADGENGSLALNIDQDNLNLSAANTYSGGTTIAGGSVTTSNASALGTGSVTINGGTLHLDSALAMGSLSGTGGTIAMGEHALSINQVSDGTYAGSISGVGALTKTGAGTLTLAGSNSVGSTHLEQGRLVAAADGALGSVTMAEGTTLVVSNEATVSMTNASAAAPAGAIVIESGTLNYNAGSSTTLGSASGSGTFALVGGTVNLGSTAQFTVSNVAVSNAALNLNGVTDFGSRQLTVGEGGTVTAYADSTLASSTLIVNGGTVQADESVGGDFFYVGSLSGTGGTVDSNGKYLVINQSVDGRYDGGFAGGNITKRGNATLELGGLVSSDRLMVDSGTVKLANSTVFGDSGNVTTVLYMNGGVFDINGQTSGSGASSFMFDVDNGYLTFRGADDMLVTDTSGREGSGLGFNSHSQWAAESVTHWGDGHAEIAADIISGGEGAAGTKIGFGIYMAGDLEVSGDIGADQSVAEHHQFGIAKNGSGTMILSGNNGYTGGTDVNSGTLVAASNTALGNGNVTVASGATLEVAEGVELSLKGTLNLAEQVTVTQQNAGSAATLGAMEMGSSGATAYIHGKVEGGLATLDNAVIDIAKDATLEMKDVLLTQGSRITDDPATLSLTNVTVEVGAGNVSALSFGTLGASLTLASTSGLENTTAGANTQVVNLFCSSLDTVNVTGTSLTLDLSAYAAEIESTWSTYEYIAISFGESVDSLAHFDAANLSIYATVDGLYHGVYVNMSELSSAAVLYISTNAVPEPTTATLSLLALSLLAARRRRK